MTWQRARAIKRSGGRVAYRIRFGSHRDPWVEVKGEIKGPIGFGSKAILVADTMGGILLPSGVEWMELIDMCAAPATATGEVLVTNSAPSQDELFTVVRYDPDGVPVIKRGKAGGEYRLSNKGNGGLPPKENQS